MTAMPIKLGDFSALAETYGQYRVGYSDDILSALLGLFPASPVDLDFVDTGAGTGIWTRMVAARGCRCRAVEPNDAMRQVGVSQNGNSAIAWYSGSAEKTGLESECADWISMASSFHWTDLPVALAEFHRILRPGGRFTCLWNPRKVEANPITAGIEQWIQRVVPELKRKSSGRSEFTVDLPEKLCKSGLFADCLFMEADFTVDMSRDRYLGVWTSVNDIQSQAGPERWREILDHIEEATREHASIPCVYATRAWTVRRVG